MKEETLARIIERVVGVTSGERDMYPHIRDLLTRQQCGINLKADQIQVDTTIGKSAGAPDLAVYATQGGKAHKTAEHLAVVIEAKAGDTIRNHGEGIFEEKRKYIQSGTRYFYLIDQVHVQCRHVQYDVNAAPVNYTWDELKDAQRFQDCFGPIRRKQLALEDELERFRQGDTRYAYRDIAIFGRGKFTSSIRQVSQILQAAVKEVIAQRIRADVTRAHELVAEMEAKWGQADMDWRDPQVFPVEFAVMTDEESARKLTHEQVQAYYQEHDEFRAKVDPYLYALRLEAQTLQQYAVRSGIEARVSFTGSGDADRAAVEAFAYETASLILSRILMIRFSEDHGLMEHYISNGGVSVFAQYARHFRAGYQELLKLTYENARELYRGLFDPNILDWVLNGKDENFSDALLHCMYLVSRWNFTTVRGDILSGVYDHYLDPGKRRDLGEVFTRPEIARYIVQRCGYGPQKSLLDPACGTGTFIVEAMEMELSRMEQAGLLSPEAIKSILPQLNGLDINPFSIALTQIQMIWHLMRLFKAVPQEKVKEIVSEVIPAMHLFGGHSSLEAMGRPMAKVNAQGALELGSQPTKGARRKHGLSVPPRFRAINGGQYDVVVGNPPFVRAHRRQLRDDLVKAYEEVAHGQFDLYLLFVYRALRAWLKDGGRMGFIVPMGLLDAGYAQHMREVLREYRLVEIVDLELLRKKTFHGIKRPVVILVVEKSPGHDDDEVDVVTVTPECYDAGNDRVDLDKARRTTVRRKDVFQSSYLPAKLSFGHLLDYARDEQSQWLSKVTADDVEVLKTLGQKARLGDWVQHGWHRRRKGAPTDIGLNPTDNDKRWREVLLMGRGLELGGKKALGEVGKRIFKGQNIFAGGLLGEPMGLYDFERGGASALNLYLYRELLAPARTFAFREIAHVPMCAQGAEDVVFQNTAYVVMLADEFPLHVFVESKIVQFYAAKTMRASVIEDLGSTWYKRQIALLPMPGDVSADWIQELGDKGEELIQADRLLADRYRDIQALLDEMPSHALDQLFMQGHPITNGLNLSDVPEEEIVVTRVELQGEGEGEAGRESAEVAKPVAESLPKRRRSRKRKSRYGPAAAIAAAITTSMKTGPQDLVEQKERQGRPRRRCDFRPGLQARALGRSSTDFSGIGQVLDTQACIHWLHSSPWLRKVRGFAYAFSATPGNNSWQPVGPKTSPQRR